LPESTACTTMYCSSTIATPANKPQPRWIVSASSESAAAK
jgi:hypothetical protein